jgi:cysteine desulfurase/selenocysteine lyase
MIDKFAEIREHYPVIQKYTYLDTATSGLISKDSYQKIRDHLDRRFQEGMDIAWYRDCWKNADKMREKVAEIINAAGNEIFFESNNSTAINVLSTGLEFAPGSNVVTTELAYPPIVYTWQNQQKRGLEVRLASQENGMVPTTKLLELVDDQTIAISISCVENTTGFRHNLEEIGRFCRERGIIFAVDATQCIGALEIDVQKMAIDFLTVSSYKWLNNVFGIGFGYVNRELLPKLGQTYMGWAGNVDRLNRSRYYLSPSPGAERFESGGLNWIGLVGLEAAIQTYLDLGKAEVEEYLLGLTDTLYARVAESDTIQLLDFPKDNRSTINCLRLPSSWELTNVILVKNGIRANFTAGNLLRVGFHFYNNVTDIDNLFDFFAKCEQGTIFR